MHLVGARYGAAGDTVDVTHSICWYVDNQVRIQVSNEIFGDPAVGRPKVLVIEFDIGTLMYKEDQYVVWEHLFA
jgi:hypothetical protein